MNYWANKWIISESIRLLLSASIILPILILSFFNVGLNRNLFARLQVQWIQEYLIYAVLAVAFSYFLLRGAFRNWVLFYGIGLSFIGLKHIVFNVYVFSDSQLITSDYAYLILMFLPIVSVITATVLIWRLQGLETSNNSRGERIIAAIGTIVTLVLMFAQFLPWARDISKATSNTWEFQGSGTKVLIKECCYASELDLAQNLTVYLPLVGLSLLFVIAALGYRVSGPAFIPSLIWCLEESLFFLTSIGLQDPLEIWTSQQIRENGLSSLREGLFGGYLFVGTSVCFAILLLIPRVINGQPSMNQARGD
jgi:hypothetical protein